MSNSLTLYGLGQPQVAYTDNMADKAFLEDCFPSLLDNVIPVDKFGHLPLFTLPSDVRIIERKTEGQIIDALASITHALKASKSGKLVVGLDSEWNVSLRKGDRPGPTAILQIAFDNVINICYVSMNSANSSLRLMQSSNTQVSQFTRHNRLPHLLCTMLANSNVIKAGRNVAADLKRLQLESKHPEPFVGGIDLAKMAKDRALITSARSGLAALSAAVLQKRIIKDSALRVSEGWEDTDLSSAQLTYAATDAYVSYALYRAMEPIPVPGDVAPDACDGTPVSVLQDDKSVVIAHGYIKDRQKHIQIRGRNLTVTRSVVEITKVLVPGALISLHDKAALASFGAPPFLIISPTRLLQTRPASPLLPIPPPPNPSSSLPAPPNLPLVPHTPSTSSTALPPAVPAATALPNVTMADSGLEADADHMVDGQLEDDPGRALSDENGEHAIKAILAEFASKDIVWATQILSRVLKDPWHAMDMVTVPRAHGLRAAFARALRDALFVPDKDDRERVSAYLSSTGSSWEEKLRLDPKWLWKRCKRVIPPPNIIFPLVADVYKTYGPLRDAKTGAPLFNENAWKASRNVLDLIHHGFLSDPPGIALYYAYGTDQQGLTLYRCVRGTNTTEGAVHRPIRHLMPRSGSGPRHTRMAILDFACKRNLRVRCFPSLELCLHLIWYSGRHIQSHGPIMEDPSRHLDPQSPPTPH